MIEGDRLGGKIGFPTANLTVFNEELPPDGVYAVEAVLKRISGIQDQRLRDQIATLQREIKSTATRLNK